MLNKLLSLNLYICKTRSGAQCAPLNKIIQEIISYKGRMKKVKRLEKNERDKVGLKKSERGVSLIALVITIIVVLILAAIAFNNSTSTIGKANYSKFVSNISEVQDAIIQKALSVKGDMVAKGRQITDEQAYNYAARGGKTDDDVLTRDRIPDYTVISKTADIGIKLPAMRVETKTKSNVEVTYAITRAGTVFVWPPYQYEEKYIINATSEVSESLVDATGYLDITVANVPLTISTNAKGELEGLELLADGLTRKEFETILEKIDIGNYVNYNLTTKKKVATLSNKTGAASQLLETEITAKWRIIGIDQDTGKILITTEGPVNDQQVTLRGAAGYLNGAEELNRLCERLYSNTEKGLTARSMTIEDLDKATGNSAPANNTRYAWYTADATETTDVTVNGKVYTGRKHQAALAGGVTKPRFYDWDDASGVTHKATNENDYNDNISATTPVLTSRTFYGYNPGTGNAVINDILGGDETHRGWLASSCVSMYSENEYVNFAMRTAYSGNVYGHYLCNSTGGVVAPSFGLCPVVEFSAKLLDVADTSRDGSSLAPWNIK